MAFGKANKKPGTKNYLFNDFICLLFQAIRQKNSYFFHPDFILGSKKVIPL
jgi:hypothetical protein